MIARDLGKGHQEMLDSLSNVELIHWMALYEVEEEERAEAAALRRR